MENINRKTFYLSTYQSFRFGEIFSCRPSFLFVLFVYIRNVLFVVVEIAIDVMTCFETVTRKTESLHIDEVTYIFLSSNCLLRNCEHENEKKKHIIISEKKIN